MKVLFTYENGHTPEFTGGVQSNTDFLIRALQHRGYRPSLLCKLFGQGLFGIIARAKMTLSGEPWVRDRALGYDVRRAWSPTEVAGRLAESLQPDVAIVQCHQTVPIGLELQKAGVPLVVYFHNVEFDELGGDPRQLDKAVFISNSEFTRDRYLQAFGIKSHVINPSIEKERYAVRRVGRQVTFINPIEKKGLKRAVAIAALCPEIEFLFVESWSLDMYQHQKLLEAIATLPNVTFVRRRADMRDIYKETKLLIVPSIWEETWGRVVSEAHCAGIPVLASRVGGLSEAVGPGGVLLDKSSTDQDWADEIKKLWYDPPYYKALSKAALAYSCRKELMPEKQVERLEALIASAIAMRKVVAQA